MTPGLAKTLAGLWILICFSAVATIVWVVIHFIHKWW